MLGLGPLMTAYGRRNLVNHGLRGCPRGALPEVRPSVLLRLRNPGDSAGDDRHKVTDEFKREAVALLGSSGRPLSGSQASWVFPPRCCATGAMEVEGGRRGRRGTRYQRRRRIPPRTRRRDFPASSRERSAADGARHFKKAVAIYLGKELTRRATASAATRTTAISMFAAAATESA